MSIEFNMNNLNHKAEVPVTPETAGHWEEGLDGKKFFVHTPRALFEKESGNEIIEDLEAVSSDTENAKNMVLHFLRDAISQGAAEGWDTVANKPSELFVERVGAEIEKMVKERAPGWKEADIVYDLLRSEPFPLQNEREQKMKAALLKRASSGKYAH